MTLIKEPHSPRGLVPSSTYGRFDEPYNAYLDSLDPRGESPRSKAVQFALASARDQRFQRFFEFLYDGRFKKTSLAALAKMCDIGLPEWAEFWQKATVQRALAKAQDALPNLAEDLIEDARSRVVGCERCGGKGLIRDECPMCGNQVLDCPHCGGKGVMLDCPDCGATGRQRKPGDTDSRKMLLEMTGLGGRRAPMVQINQDFSTTGIGSSVDRLSKISFEVQSEPAQEGSAPGPVPVETPVEPSDA